MTNLASAETPALATKAASHTELLSVQYLRAFAAFGVVLTHAAVSLLDNERPLLPFGYGGAGVDLFFAISGFIMMYTTFNRKMNPGSFYKRRLIRIWPLYIVISSVAFGIAKLAPGMARTFSPRWIDYIRSILFIPYYTVMSLGSAPVVQPEIGVGWSLNYEMFFYLVFGVCLLLRPGKRVLLICLFFVLTTFVGLIFHPSGALLNTYANPITLEFVLGMFIGYLFVEDRDRKTRNWCSAVIIIVGAVFLALQVILQPSWSLALTRGLPTAALLVLALILEGLGRVKMHKLLLLLGNASYSLYLTHGFVLAILRRLWQRYTNVEQLWSHVTFAAASLLIACFVGVACYRLIELPLTQFFSRAFSMKSKPQIS